MPDLHDLSLRELEHVTQALAGICRQPMTRETLEAAEAAAATVLAVVHDRQRECLEIEIAEMTGGTVEFDAGGASGYLGLDAAAPSGLAWRALPALEAWASRTSLPHEAREAVAHVRRAMLGSLTPWM